MEATEKELVSLDMVPMEIHTERHFPEKK